MNTDWIEREETNNNIMDKFLQAIVARLLKTNAFSITQIEQIKLVIAEVGQGFTLEDAKNELVTQDLMHPPGYEEYFANKIMQGMSVNTINMYKYQVDRFLLAVQKKLSDITSQDIALYLFKKRANGEISEVSANNARRCLLAFFVWLFNNGYMSKNIAVNVSPIKEPYRKADTMNAEEFEKLMSACKCQRDRALIAVTAGSGIRRGEISGLLRKDVDMQHGEFNVIGKGNKERTCFLTPRAKHELEQYLKTRDDDSPYLFVSQRTHKQLSPRGINFITKEIGKRAGIAFHTHMLRHYFADTAHEADIDVLDIARMLGHSSVNTTQIYINQNTADLAYKHQRIR